MCFAFNKGKGSCKSSTILGGDEWLDGFTEVAIEPVGHVIWLLEPRFGCASLNQVYQHENEQNKYVLSGMIARSPLGMSSSF
jgi:hypothetical protein